MTIRRFGALIAGGALFISGVAVGQQQATGKFTRYYAPARISEMDVSLIFTNLAALKVNASSNFPLPSISFDQKTRKFMIKRLVRGNPQRELQALSAHADTDYIGIVANFPEATESDVVWLFTDAETTHEFLADRKDGVLIFR